MGCGACGSQQPIQIRRNYDVPKTPQTIKLNRKKVALKIRTNSDVDKYRK